MNDGVRLLGVTLGVDVYMECMVHIGAYGPVPTTLMEPRKEAASVLQALGGPVGWLLANWLDAEEKKTYWGPPMMFGFLLWDG